MNTRPQYMTAQRQQQITVSLTWSLIDWFKDNTTHNDYVIAKHISKIVDDFESRFFVPSSDILDMIRQKQDYDQNCHRRELAEKLQDWVVEKLQMEQSNK